MPLRRRRGRRFGSASVALPVCALVVAGAGCGSSSKSSSSARVSSTTSTSSRSSSGSQRLTKAQYEQKLGPLLNNVIDPALRDALSNGGARSPRKLGAAITLLRLSHDQMAAAAPPAAVADLHKRTVAALVSMISDMTKLRVAEARSDTSAGSAAVAALKTDAQRLETLGSQFTSRGY
jgi:hypothetical protein